MYHLKRLRRRHRQPSVLPEHCNWNPAIVTNKNNVNCSINRSATVGRKQQKQNANWPRRTNVSKTTKTFQIETTHHYY